MKEIKKPDRGHGGGRPAGPASKRMTFYLENSYVTAIRKSAENKRTTLSDILMQSIHPSIIDNERHVKVSDVLKILTDEQGDPKYVISRKQYDKVFELLDMAVRMLFLQKTFCGIQPDGERSAHIDESYLNWESQVADCFDAFLSHAEPDGAMMRVREDVDELYSGEGQRIRDNLTKLLSMFLQLSEQYGEHEAT